VCDGGGGGDDDYDDNNNDNTKSYHAFLYQENKHEKLERSKEMEKSRKGVSSWGCIDKSFQLCRVNLFRERRSTLLLPRVRFRLKT
jgi:hypothetical protein